jgi:hypothetical protein
MSFRGFRHYYTLLIDNLFYMNIPKKIHKHD